MGSRARGLASSRKDLSGTRHDSRRRLGFPWRSPSLSRGVSQHVRAAPAASKCPLTITCSDASNQRDIELLLANQGQLGSSIDKFPFALAGVREVLER